MIGSEKHSAPKSDHMKENGIGDPTNQRSNKKLQPDNSTFSRSHIQASGGKSPGMYSPPLKKTPNMFHYEIFKLAAFQVCSHLWSTTISKARVPSLI